MKKNYWIVKQEPGAYAWAQLAAEGQTAWTGVRNFQARNFLRAMNQGDPVLFYHSGDEKQVVGLALVETAAYPDPTAEEGDWSAVDLAPVKAMNETVALATLRADPAFKEMLLVRNSRISVSPLTAAQFRRVMSLARTKL